MVLSLKQANFKLPIDLSYRKKSEISTIHDVYVVAGAILSNTVINPINLTMSVGNDGDIAYGYRSKSSDVAPYGALSTAEAIYRKIIAIRSMDAESNETYVVLNGDMPLSKIIITYDTDLEVTLLKSEGNTSKYISYDEALKDFIISSNGTDIDIKLQFLK